MSDLTVINRLQEIIAHDLDANIALEDIGVDTPLFEDGLGLDSIVLVELIALVEKNFGIKFADNELNPEAFSTVRSLADTILAK